GGDEERVAVLRRLCCERGAERAARAGLVVDEHLPAPLRGELLRERAREDVEAAARGVGRDDLHGALRERLRVQCRGERKGQNSQAHGGDGLHRAMLLGRYAARMTPERLAPLSAEPVGSTPKELGASMSMETKTPPK